MTIDEFVLETSKGDENSFCMRPAIWCKDGFSMSVQGSYGHYCNPRIITDRYNSMEIGFPNQGEMETPTNTVYGYVPVSIIQEVIEKHGGIDIKKTFNQPTI